MKEETNTALALRSAQISWSTKQLEQSSVVSRPKVDTDNRYERLQKMLRNIPIVQWWNSRGEKVETRTSEQKLEINYCFKLSRWRIVRKLLTFSNFTTTTSTGSRE